jgi:hypothetical protein
MIAAFDLDVGDAMCSGFIMDAPDYVFEIGASSDPVTIHLEANQDSALVVVGPDGAVHCNDDSVTSENTNPSISIANPTEGRYAVFVARLDQDAPLEGTLTVTTEADAAPEVLPPSQ